MELNNLTKNLRRDEWSAREIRDQQLTDLDGMDFGDSWAIKTHARNVYNRVCERSIFDLKINYKVEREILQAEAEVVYNSNLSTLKNRTYEAQWFWLKTPKSYTESIDKHSEDYLGPFNAYRKAYSKFYYSTSNDYNPYVFEALSNIIGSVKNFITEGTLPLIGVATLLTTTLLLFVPENIQALYVNFFTKLVVRKIIIAHLVGDMVLQAYNWYHNKAISFSAIIIWTKVLICAPIITYIILMLTMDHDTRTIDYFKLWYQILYDLSSICMSKSDILNIKRFYKWLLSFWS